MTNKSDQDGMFREAREAFAARRAEAIEDRVARALGTGKDVALWERYEYELPNPKIHLAFRDIEAGSIPAVSPCGFEASVCTVFRTSVVKVGRA